MARSWVRLATCVVSGAAFLVLNGCGAQPDDGYSTPPPSSYSAVPQADLSGGPTPPTRRRAADESGLAGGPSTTASTRTAYAGMAPIANPNDMPYDQCMQVYGPGKCRGGPRSAPAGYGAKPAPARTTYASGRGTMDPIPNPEDMSPSERRRVYPSRYAARAATAPARRRSYYSQPSYAPAPSYAARPAPKPAATATYAPPPAPVPAPKPASSYAPAAPLPAPAATPAPPPAAPMTPTDKLSAAVKGETIKGATLTVPDALSKGQPAKVTLTLPQDLLGIIQREAAKLGLTKQARKAEVSATLSGQGYAIDPPGKQTKPLTAGQATSFDWQVKPGTGEKTPLRADVDGALVGKGKPMNFSLGSLEQAMATAVDDVKAKAKGFKWPSLSSLSWPGMPTLDIGGVKAKTANVSAGLLALLALLVVWMMARSAGASRARAERRRKYRTMTDYGRNEMESEPAAPATSSDSHDSHDDGHGHGYVNPMIAAAGGAALGAAAAHAADEHHARDDHGADSHGHDDHGHHDQHDDHSAVAPLAQTTDDGHGHDDHGHDAHGHDAQAHDDHGHDAHDDQHAPTTLSSDDGHGHDAQGHDDHGHGDHGSDPAPLGMFATTSADHSHDDHGHDNHGHDEHGTDDHVAAVTDGHDEHHGHADHAHKDHHEHEHA